MLATRNQNRRIRMEHTPAWMLTRVALVWLLLTGFAVPARADATVFFGVTPPKSRPTIGFAFGLFGDTAVGFELESARRIERAREREFEAFGVNVMVRLPIRAHGARLYASAGFGISSAGEAGYTNIGMGTKVLLAGPLQLRVDYRFFRFPEEGRNEEVGLYPHRLAVGLTLPF